MPPSIPHSFGTVIIDAKSLYQSSMENISRSGAAPENAFREQLLSITSQVKRIVVEHKPKRLLMVHTKGFSDELPPEGREVYDRWKELSGLMGVPEANMERKAFYGFVAKALMDHRPGGRPGLIVSSDGLLGAHLGPGVFYEDAEGLEVYGREKFTEKYGFDPNYLVEFYGLVGHEEIGIRGIDFIGPRKASEWLSGVKGDPVEYIKNEFGNSRLGRIFIKKEAEFSSNLSLIEDVMSHSVDALPVMQPNVDQNHALHEHYNSERVTSHREAINNALERHELFELLPKSDTGDLTACIDRISAVSSINHLEEAKSISLYFEHGGKSGEVSGIGVSSGGQSYGFPLNKASGYDEKWLIGKLSQVLEKDSVGVVANDAKIYYKLFGKNAKPLLADSAVLSYSINSGNGRSSFVDLAERFAPDITFNHAPYAVVSDDGSVAAGEYLAERANASLILNRRLFEVARGTPALDYYRSIEQPTSRILAGMDKTGITIDRGHLEEMRDSLSSRRDELLSFINKRLPNGDQIQELGKPQVERLLFDVFRLSPPKLTRTGARSVRDEVLEQLEETHWLPKIIREHRKIGTLLSGTITPMLNRMSEGSNVIYPTFNQCVAITGRLSASDPNVQAIPIRTKEGQRVREAFIANDKRKIVAVDYSQIELRVLAHISGDKNLINAFLSGADPHAATASQIFKVSEGEVSKEQRGAAKAINFGIVYGLTPFGLAKRLGIDEERAKSFIDRYFEAFPGVKEYLDDISKAGIENGYVDTLGGRRISLFTTTSGATRSEIDEAKRRACNYPMQGSAAEIIKLAMIDVDKMIENEFPDVRMLMQVHDELVFEVPSDQDMAFVSRVKEVMSSAANLCVPLEVDEHCGRTWREGMDAEEDHRKKLEISPEEASMAP